MRVAASMTLNPVCVPAETPLPEARDLLHRRGLRHLPVVDGEGRLLGMVSDRDLRAAFPSTVLDPLMQPDQVGRLEHQPVSSIMGRPPVALPSDATGKSPPSCKIQLIIFKKIIFTISFLD